MTSPSRKWIDFVREEEVGHLLDYDLKRKVYYHLTRKANLPGILREGLLPQARRSGRKGFGDYPLGEDVGRIFLARNKREAWEQIEGNIMAGLPVPRRSNLVLLRVIKPETHELYVDESGFLFIDQSIPPENIKVVR